MFDIFTSLSKPDPQTCPKPTPQQRTPLDERTSPSSTPNHHLWDSIVLAVPATTANFRNPLRPQDTGLSDGDIFTRRRGFGKAGSSWNLPPLITQPSVFDHSHTQQDLTDSRLLPSTSRRLEDSTNTSYPSSPTKQKDSATASLAGRLIEQTKKGTGRGRIADWFQGESGPINISLLPSPTKDKADISGIMSASSISNPPTTQRKFNSQTPSKPQLASRFSFFSSKASTPKSPPQSSDCHDEFLDLDINTELFPGGTADPFSPAAFKNLVQNAEGLLLRLQTAYKERTISLQEMTAEKETQAEELEGTEARAKHLKLQLDDMAAQLAKQDDVIMDLVDSLAREKQLRREEEDARKRSVMLVKTSRAKAFGHSDPGITEAEEYRRQSGVSLVSDSGFESEEESVVDSVFSKSRDLRSNASELSFSTSTSPDLYHRPESISMPIQVQRALPRTLSTCQSAIKLTPGGSRHEELVDLPNGNVPSTCSNCHGVRSSQAWNMVANVKEENRVLSARLAELEGALDGCLDLVNRLGA